MGWIMRDFECTKGCGPYEDLLKTDEEQVADCPVCGLSNPYCISAVAAANYSIQDQAGRTEILRKRSSEHSTKYNRQNHGIEPKK